MEKKQERKKYLIIVGGIFLICCLSIAMIVISYGVGKLFVSTPKNGQDNTATENPGHVYLDDIGRVSIIGNISTQEVNYPENWHEDFIMPELFVLVEAYLPTQFESDPNIWASKFIYHGEFESSIKAITEYLQEQRWDLLDTQRYYENLHFLIFDRQSGEYVTVLIEDSASKSGIVFIQMNAYMNQR